MKILRSPHFSFFRIQDLLNTAGPQLQANALRRTVSLHSPCKEKRIGEILLEKCLGVSHCELDYISFFYYHFANNFAKSV